MDEQTQKKSILIIDDDTFLIDMYAMKFKEHGFEVITSPSTTDALTKLKDGLKPQVILSDIVMPTINGIDFVRRVKDEKLAPESVVIMLSNQSQNEQVEEAMKAGADGFIIKANVVPSEIYEKVVEILSKKG